LDGKKLEKLVRLEPENSAQTTFVFCQDFNIAFPKKTEYYSSKKMLEFILFAEAKHKTHEST
jgi:hypothetical protein